MLWLIGTVVSSNTVAKEKTKVFPYVEELMCPPFSSVRHFLRPTWIITTVDQQCDIFNVFHRCEQINVLGHIVTSWTSPTYCVVQFVTNMPLQESFNKREKSRK